jgi:LuxR family quorum sensing-dependent transcriptional regulator
MPLHILEVIEELERVETPEAVLGALRKSKTLNEFGIEWFCIALPVHPGQRFEDRVLGTEQPHAWYELYLKDQLCHVDAALRHCKRADLPFRWLDAPLDLENEPKFLEMRRRAHDFKVDKGVMVPVHGYEGFLGSVWLGGHHLSEADRKRAKPIVYPICIYAFHRMRQLADHQTIPDVTLSEREKEILRWTAVGKSAWDVSEILNLSNRTVEWHIAEAMKKIGATNRVQAVVLALKRGLISI